MIVLTLILCSFQAEAHPEGVAGEIPDNMNKGLYELRICFNI